MISKIMSPCGQTYHGKTRHHARCLYLDGMGSARLFNLLPNQPHRGETMPDSDRVSYDFNRRFPELARIKHEIEYNRKFFRVWTLAIILGAYTLGLLHGRGIMPLGVREYPAAKEQPSVSARAQSGEGGVTPRVTPLENTGDPWQGSSVEVPVVSSSGTSHFPWEKP